MQITRIGEAEPYEATRHVDVSALRLNRFDHHAGPLGHRLAAEALLRAFGARWRARGG